MVRLLIKGEGGYMAVHMYAAGMHRLVPTSLPLFLKKIFHTKLHVLSQKG